MESLVFLPGFSISLFQMLDVRKLHCQIEDRANCCTCKLVLLHLKSKLKFSCNYWFYLCHCHSLRSESSFQISCIYLLHEYWRLSETTHPETVVHCVAIHQKTSSISLTPSWVQSNISYGIRWYGVLCSMECDYRDSEQISPAKLLSHMQYPWYGKQYWLPHMRKLTVYVRRSRVSKHPKITKKKSYLLQGSLPSHTTESKSWVLT